MARDDAPAMISDPWFWAAAVPAVLLMGLAKSGFAQGFGSMATPLMALTVPVPQAAAIMLPVLAVQDLLGLAALWRDRDRALLRLLLPAGLAGVALGTLLFGLLKPGLVAGVVGLLTLAFLAIRLFVPVHAASRPLPRPLGAVLGAASGFTSFVAHAGSPPIGFYVLPLQLAPRTFTATMSVFFAAINAAKWGPYAWLGLIDLRNMSTSLALLPLAPLGVWAGLKLSQRIPARLFYRLFLTGMGLTGVKLVADGWRAL